MFVVYVESFTVKGSAVAMTVFYPLDTARLALQGRLWQHGSFYRNNGCSSVITKVSFVLVFSG